MKPRRQHYGPPSIIRPIGYKKAAAELEAAKKLVAAATSRLEDLAPKTRVECQNCGDQFQIGSQEYV